MGDPEAATGWKTFQKIGLWGGMPGFFLEWLFSIGVVRWTAGAAFVVRGAFFFMVGNCYRGLNDLCWVSRVSGAGYWKRLADGVIQRVIAGIKRDRKNILVDSYLASKASARCAALYSITGGGGAHDIFRDVIVLKSPSTGEKGVILLKYARTFDAVVAIFDLPRLLDRYLFVLEPCWAGYCDPSILMFLTPGHHVIVQCFTEEDHRFISSIGRPFIPVRLGPADWVDTDRFANVHTGDKTYDLVMVANWAAHKRHAELFRALSQIRDRKIRVLLIGFPWGSRTADDIRREAALAGNAAVEIDILEQVPQQKLARHLSQCKVFVFLSRKEGDNKALVESMFVGLPAIVFDKTIGGARARINPLTGILASDEELSGKILYMLDHYKEFSPRAWALKHSGSSMSTRVLSDVIRRLASEAGEKFTEDIQEKTNSPNLAYKDSARRDQFKQDYEFIRSCQRRSLKS